MYSKSTYYMSKYDLRIKARKMRAEGESVREIAKKLGIARSTTSLWVRDIILSVEQMEYLKKRRIKAGELGRLKGSLMQKERRLITIKKMGEIGKIKFADISDQEFFVAGIALYWAEGSKKTVKLQFCNSDPKLINFLIKWLNRFFDIKTDRLSVRVAINEIHRTREAQVKKYWSEVTKIPLSQFRKTSFKKTTVHKVYENYERHFGTLDVSVLKPGELYYKILGFIEGLANVAQW